MKWLIRNLTFLLIALLPFYSFLRAILLIKDMQFLIAPLSYLRDLIIIILLMLSSLFVHIKTKKIILKMTPMTIGVFFLLLNYIIGLFINIIYGNYLMFLKAFHVSVIPLLLYFFIVIYKSNFYEFSKKIISHIELLGIIILVLAFIFYIIRPEFYLKLFHVYRDGQQNSLIWEVNYVRMVGPFFSPNVFATFMSIIAIIFLNQYINKPSLKRLIVILFVILSVILSLSRGAWMFLFMGSVVSLYYWKGISVWISYLIKGFVILVLLLFTLSLVNPDIFNVITDRFYSLNITEGKAFDRSDNWKIVKEGLIKYPLGHGAGIGGQISADNKNRSFEIPVIDGFYVKTIAETGLIGMFSLIMLIWLTVWQLRKSILLTNGKEKVIHVSALGIFLGFCIQSVGSNPFDFITVAPFLWIFLGISNYIYSTKDD